MELHGFLVPKEGSPIFGHNACVQAVTGSLVSGLAGSEFQSMGIKARGL